MNTLAEIQDDHKYKWSFWLTELPHHKSIHFYALQWTNINWEPEPLLGTAHPSAVFYMGKLFENVPIDNRLNLCGSLVEACSLYDTSTIFGPFIWHSFAHWKYIYLRLQQKQKRTEHQWWRHQMESVTDPRLSFKLSLMTLGWETIKLSRFWTENGSFLPEIIESWHVWWRHRDVTTWNL